MMIRNTIEEIKEKIQKGSSIKEENRAELLNLLGLLEQEIANLSTTHKDEAESIVGFTGVSAHEATREHKDPQLLELSLNGLSSSIREFEDSHPKLVEITNAICVALSNLGI